MNEPSRDLETPVESAPSAESSQSKRSRYWRAAPAAGAIIVLAAIVLFYFLFPNKPAWLNACPFLHWDRSANLLFKFPPTRTPPATYFETAVSIQVEEQPTITPAPTLSMATATPPVTITPAPTSQPPRTNPTPSVAPGQYQAQDGSPFYISAKPFRESEQACKWLGIAGQAFDAQDSPRSNLVVVVDGVMGDKEVNLTTVTGTALLYGPAGYEIGISLKPQDSEGTLTIQLFSDTGQPLSEKVPFATFASCEKNLAIVNFVEMK